MSTAPNDGRGRRRVRVGFAGLGIGTAMLLEAAELRPEIAIVAAADPRESARASFEQRYGGKAYATIDELGQTDVDVVCVSTPNHLHCQHVVTLARYGKHIVCTKPMALTVEECETMCFAAERNNVALQCGQTYSLSPGIQAMAKIVRSGELGRVIAITSYFATDWLLKPRIAEELDEARGGGVLYRHGPHLVDTVRVLVGAPFTRVRGSVGRWMTSRPCAGNFSAYLETDDGTPATITYNGYGYFDTSELTDGLGNRAYTDDERVRVRAAMAAGTFDSAQAKEAARFGAASIDSLKGSAFRTNYRNTRFGVTVASCEGGDVRESPSGVYVYSDAGKREIAIDDEVFGQADLREISEFVLDGKPIVHDGWNGLATLAVIDAIGRSAADRREIALSSNAKPSADTSALSRSRAIFR